jgi:hypothetical protein
MAKQKAVKLQNFFEGYRRKAYLVRYEHLKDRKEYGEFKLELRLPLLNESVLGMNGVISDAFGLLAKDDSQLGRTVLEVQMDGMTTEFFSTGDTKQSKIPVFSSAGVRLTKLSLVPNREDEKREVNLELSVYIPASEQLRDWAYRMIHSEFHLEAVYSQSEMDFEDETDADSDEDDEGEELDQDNEENAGLPKDQDIPFDTPAPAAAKSAAKPPMPKKSGPRELAAFHATQKPN